MFEHLLVPAVFSLADVGLQVEAKDKIKDGATKQDENRGNQQGSGQHTAEVIQLPHLAEASGKPEVAVGPVESKTSAGQQNKKSSPKNTNALPPIVWPERRVCLLFPHPPCDLY